MKKSNIIKTQDFHFNVEYGWLAKAPVFRIFHSNHINYFEFAHFHGGTTMLLVCTQCYLNCKCSHRTSDFHFVYQNRRDVVFWFISIIWMSFIRFHLSISNAYVFCLKLSIYDCLEVIKMGYTQVCTIKFSNILHYTNIHWSEFLAYISFFLPFVAEA